MTFGELGWGRLQGDIPGSQEGAPGSCGAHWQQERHLQAAKVAYYFEILVSEKKSSRLVKTATPRGFGLATTSLKTNGSHLGPRIRSWNFLQPMSMTHPHPAKYKIMVKAVNILHVDTSLVLEVDVK